MSRSTPLRTRALSVSTVAALLTTLLIALGQLPASAATVTAVTGSAYGYRAFNIKLLGSPRRRRGPLPA